MPWMKVGDESDTFPLLMDLAAFEGFDHRTMNEVQGFVFRCAAYSAKHLTDSIVDLGVIAMYAGSESERLIRLCTEVGLMSWVEVDGRRKLKLVENPDYINIRTKEEIEHERQQNRDNRDPAIKGPVLLRDGDTCRWCETPVYWTGKPSARKGTLDHLKPGQAATVDTMVVACWRCNSARKQDESDTWAKEHPLVPAPARPRYGKATTKYLEGLGLLIPPVSTSDASADAASASTSDTPSAGVLPGLDGAGDSVEGSADSGRSPADVDLRTADHRSFDEPSADDDPGAASGERAGGVSESESGLNSDSIRIDSDMSTPANSESPGRVGTGLVDSGQAGPGLEWPGQPGTGSGGAGRGRDSPGSGRAREGAGLAGGAPCGGGSVSGRKRRRKRRKDRG